ncbi:MAG: MATE family efflux transporter [Lachnospiraceae bacterium]|nr:MATE family efflux transporter [Lachnospiraceae bacterium]
MAENKMGVQPIPKLLFGMSLPIIISMLVQAMYNVVDSIFVSQISEDALTAVSLVFPVQNLLLAFSIGTAVGMASLLSRNLGEKNFNGVNKAATNGIFLAVISAIIFAILGISLSGTFFATQTNNMAGNRDIIVKYGIEYMDIISACSIFVFLQITFERLLQSTGKAVPSMISQALGAIVNIILDPILIFGYFGLPEMGVAGAAIATVIGQFCGLLLGFIFNCKINKEIKLSFKGFRPHGGTIKSIYAVGAPSIVVQAIGSVMTFGMNKILVPFTSTAATVFGVYFKLNSFVFMPVFGLTNGMIPIAAYNYGARNRDRIIKTYKLSAIAAVIFMLIGLAVFCLFPAQLLGIFNASPDMIAIGTPALRIISLSFAFGGYCIITGCLFQALGNGVYSLWVSLVRQIFILLPSAAILANVFGLDAVWWSFPIAEIFSLVLTTLLLKRIYRLKLKNL